MVVRAARVEDAAAIAAVHVAAWRSAYAGLLPPGYLAGLSVDRNTGQFRASIAAGASVLVAESEGRVVGFCTMSRPRTAGIAEGEVETLYVLDDFRDQGLGRALLQEAGVVLAAGGCRSLFLWVLAENPNRWFYERMGGRAAMRSTAEVAGRSFDQVAYVWEPIGLLQGAVEGGGGGGDGGGGAKL